MYYAYELKRVGMKMEFNSVTEEKKIDLFGLERNSN